MKIKLINFSDVFGGQERYLVELTKWMLAKNYSVEFEGRPEGLIANNLNDDAISVQLYNGNSALYGTLRGVNRAVVNVYVHHSDINDGQQIFWRRWVRKCLLKLLLTRFDLVVRVCNKALPDAYAPNKIVTIYNGVEVKSVVEPRAPQRAQKWLMVGGVTKNKNQKLAITALKGCPDATLTIVGDGSERSELEAYAATLGVSDRIIWTGFVKNPNEYYHKCDVLLMLSHYEAFPYVVLEAMAQGMPVVAASVGGVPEILNIHNGVLLNKRSATELVNALNMLAQDPAGYASLSLQSINTIKQGFTLDHCFGKLMGVLEEKIQQKKVFAK